jgi:hypothetical protein
MTNKQHLRCARIVTILSVLTIVLSALATSSLVGWPGRTQTAWAQGPALTPTPSCRDGEFFDPVMNLCRPIQRPCPDDKIDRNENGVDDGDCDDLDRIDLPSLCMAGAALDANGMVTCTLPGNWDGRQLRASTGCLAIDRDQYPRAMVNARLTFQITRIIPPAELPFDVTESGGYQLVNGQPWEVMGAALGELYQGMEAFNTRDLLAGDPYKWPSVQNVRARLVLKRDPTAALWQLDGALGTNTRIQSGREFRLMFRRSSFSEPAQNGPDRSENNSLPAYRLRVRTAWQLYYVAQWDNYEVRNSRYTRVSRSQVEVAMGSPYQSDRVWGGRIQDAKLQSTAGLDYCTQTSYVPVPVIEVQAVLTK